MSQSSTTSTAKEINRLHDEAVRLTAGSKQSLHEALAAAWRAGQLLLTEKRRVRQTMGPDVWLIWLEQNFHGAQRTAQKYMQLAQTVPDASSLPGMSLRQAYLRLGIATEPKDREHSPRVDQLPAHVRLANRLLETLSPGDKGSLTNPDQRVAFRQDLRALYELLRWLFESGNPANLPGPAHSNRNPP